MKISSQQSLLQVILLPGEEQTIVAGERLVAPLALLPTVLLLLLELSSGLVSSLFSEGGDGQLQFRIICSCSNYLNYMESFDYRSILVDSGSIVHCTDWYEI